MSRTTKVSYTTADIPYLKSRLKDIEILLNINISICTSKPPASATPKEAEELRDKKVECTRLINDLTREKAVIEYNIKQLEHKGGMRRTRNNKKHQKNKKNKSRNYKNKQRKSIIC